MKKQLTILLCLGISAMLLAQDQLNGTLIRTSTADPCLLYENGSFYLTMTGASKIAMVKDSSLSRLTTAIHPNSKCIIYNSANDPTVEQTYGEGALINGTWSPEIHYFSEDEFPGKSGWYMYFALRQKVEAGGKTSSRNVRMVVLKSSSGKIDGPYASPVTDVEGQSQPMLDKDGEVIKDWCLGPSVLRIPSGKHKGVYITWVEETGRGEGKGNFYQKIMISKINSPWQFCGEKGIVTTPTQEWETHGSSATHPEVVEGGTAVYGDHGEVFLTYSGSGYWSDYGLGQLTLERKDDYSDPLKTKSWIKYKDNPIFSSVYSDELRGAGHAFFLKDAAGNGFMCYHAFPFVDGAKIKVRNAYIEPYRIDYETKSKTAPQGVLRLGSFGDGQTAAVSTKVSFQNQSH